MHGCRHHVPISRNFLLCRRFLQRRARKDAPDSPSVRRRTMNGVIYIIGLIVVIMFVLSFLGLR
jgi:hypothetical protein